MAAETGAEAIRLRREAKKQREEDQRHKYELKARDLLMRRQLDQQKMAYEQEKQMLSAQSRQAQMQMDAQLGQAQIQVAQELKARDLQAKQQELAAKAQQSQRQAAEQQMQEPILEPPQQIDGTRTDIDPMRNVGPQQLSVPQQGGGGQPAVSMTQGGPPSPYGVVPYIDEQRVIQGTQNDRLGWHPVTETQTTRTPNVLTAAQAAQLGIEERRLANDEYETDETLAANRRKIAQDLTLNLMKEIQDPQLAREIGVAVALGDEPRALAALGQVGSTATYLLARARTSQAFAAAGASRASAGASAASAAASYARRDVSVQELLDKQNNAIDERVKPVAAALANPSADPEQVSGFMLSLAPHEQRRALELAAELRGTPVSPEGKAAYDFDVPIGSLSEDQRRRIAVGDKLAIPADRRETLSAWAETLGSPFTSDAEKQIVQSAVSQLPAEEAEYVAAQQGAFGAIPQSSIGKTILDLGQSPSDLTPEQRQNILTERSKSGQTIVNMGDATKATLTDIQKKQTVISNSRDRLERVSNNLRTDHLGAKPRAIASMVSWSADKAGLVPIVPDLVNLSAQALSGKGSAELRKWYEDYSRVLTSSGREAAEAIHDLFGATLADREDKRAQQFIIDLTSQDPIRVQAVLGDALLYTNFRGAAYKVWQAGQQAGSGVGSNPWDVSDARVAETLFLAHANLADSLEKSLPGRKPAEIAQIAMRQIEDQFNISRGFGLAMIQEYGYGK